LTFRGESGRISRVGIPYSTGEMGMVTFDLCDMQVIW
jgi:hypothetical protein